MMEGRGWREQEVRASLAMARQESTTFCHAERSEASLAMGVEMLRCAQHDNRYVSVVTG